MIPRYIADLIESGENQTLDFKFEISDSRKIAKTLSAFANTDGGKLLIGVKDNGRIAGIRTNEEVFMIENAAKLFCKPKINYSVRPWNIEGKQILEVTINEGKKKPYFAQDYDKKWKAYVRVQDKNFLAHSFLVNFWKKQKQGKIHIQYSRKEQFLLNYLTENKVITIDDFCKYAEISKKKAENILADFLVLEIVKMKISENKLEFSFNEDFDNEEK